MTFIYKYNILYYPMYANLFSVQMYNAPNNTFIRLNIDETIT